MYNIATNFLFSSEAYYFANGLIIYLIVVGYDTKVNGRINLSLEVNFWICFFLTLSITWDSICIFFLTTEFKCKTLLCIQEFGNVKDVFNTDRWPWATMNVWKVALGIHHPAVCECQRWRTSSLKPGTINMGKLVIYLWFVIIQTMLFCLKKARIRRRW